MPSSRSRPTCRCTSAIRAVRGSAARTKIRTGCCGSTFRRATIYATCPNSSSMSWRESSTVAHAKPSGGKHRPRYSTQLLRRPVEITYGHKRTRRTKTEKTFDGDEAVAMECPPSNRLFRQCPFGPFLSVSNCMGRHGAVANPTSASPRCGSCHCLHAISHPFSRGERSDPRSHFHDDSALVHEAQNRVEHRQVYKRKEQARVARIGEPWGKNRVVNRALHRHQRPIVRHAHERVDEPGKEAGRDERHDRVDSERDERLGPSAPPLHVDEPRARRDAHAGHARGE